MATPSSQRDKCIAFALLDSGKEVENISLPIRPEDLTRQEPKRVTAVNTLDGAWVDDFGTGLTSITISGHTGWRGTNSRDGAAHFARLRDNVILQWSALRKKYAQSGNYAGVDKVRLYFMDELNNYSARVVPTNFVLRRSKSQPLLMHYNIALTAVAEFPKSNASQETVSGDLTLGSLVSAINVIKSVVKSVKALIKSVQEFGASVAAWVSDVVLPVVELAQSVIEVAKAGRELISSVGQVVVNLAADLSKAATSVLAAIHAVATLPAAAKVELLRVKSALSNVACVLTNGYANTAKYPDYTPLYGASNCSSTSGGRPESIYAATGVNTMNAVKATENPMVSVSQDAAQALSQIKRFDLASPTLDVSALVAMVTRVSKGVAIGA